MNWVLDADIRAFFDSVSWEWLVRFLEHRIADRRLVRLIGKWLKAGVLEDGRLLEVERGTPQGAVISPVLANIYLHYVYDLWVHQWRRRRAGGEVIVVRYADDTVVGFQHRSEAERFLDELRSAEVRAGVASAEDPDHRIRASRGAQAQGPKPRQAYLRLSRLHTHLWNEQGRDLPYPGHTVRERLWEKLRQVKETIWRMMHRPIAEQGLYLKRVVNGFLNYFAVPTNSRAINSFYRHVGWYWCRALRRRGQYQPADLSAYETTDRPLAAARAPSASASRRAVQRHDPRQEPGAVAPLAGI